MGPHRTGLLNLAVHRESDDDDETFTVRLDTANLPPGLTAGTPRRVTVTVEDPDDGAAYVPPVILEASPSPVAEGEAVSVSVILARASTTDVTVPLTVTRGTSEAGDHGTLASVTVPAGHCCNTGFISTNADPDGDDETFTVAVDADRLPSGYRTDHRSSVEVAIADTGTRGTGTVPAVSLAAASNPVAEGMPVRVTATLSETAPRDLAIPLRVTRNSSEARDHGTLSSLFVPAGSLSASGTIATHRDPGEDPERFTVALGTLPADLRAGSPASVAVTIVGLDGSLPATGPDTLPVGRPLLNRCTAHLPSNAVSVAEVEGWRDAHAHVAAHVLRWNRVLAALGELDALSEAQLLSGVTPMTVAQSKANEGRFMRSRWSRVTATLEAVEACLAGSGSGLTPEPPEVTLEASPNPVAEGSPVTVTVRLSAALANDVTLPLQVTRDSSEAGDHGTPASITVHAGFLSNSVPVETAADADTDDERFTVALGTHQPAAVRVGSPASVAKTITDSGTHRQRPVLVRCAALRACRRTR